MEGLFAELDFCLALVELCSFNFPEFDNGNSNTIAEDTQFAPCTRGNHELVLQDDVGLRCINCPHVELGPKDVMPPWAEKTCELSEKTRSSEIEQCPEFDKLHLESSVDNSNDFRNDGNATVWNFKPGIRESLYKHQQEGFEFLWKNLAGSINLAELKSSDPSGVGGCIISHAPGTGKTRLTIVFLETYLKLFPNCRPMIIAPACMLLTWEDEFRKWNVEFPFHDLNSLAFFGKENKTVLQLLPHARRKNRQASSTKCCYEGISLVWASRLVLLDVIWNPSIERQAISCAYRIGQKKFVYIYHLMTFGTTKGNKYCRQAKKGHLSELVFTSSSN